MSLSRALPKGIVGGGTFGRSVSCEDLSFAPPAASKDGIQLLLKAGPGRAPPVRMLASETITSVNLKVRGPSRGFYTKQHCIVSGLDTTVDDDALLELERPSERMCFVLSLSDLLYLSASTKSGQVSGRDVQCVVQVFAVSQQRLCPRISVCVSVSPCPSRSGIHVQISCRAPVSSVHASILPLDACLQACAFSPETQRKAPTTPNANRILEEDVDEEGQLVPAAGEGDSSVAFPDLLNTGNLYLLADRNQSKVYIRPASRGTCLELSVNYAPVLSDSTTSPSPLGLDAGAEQKYLGGNPGSRASLVGSVRQGLASGFAPQLTEDGSGGTYMMPDASGSKVAVFKPMDEEPLAMNCPRGMTPSKTGEGLKKGTRVGEGAFREVAAFLLDRPSPSAKATPLVDEEAAGPGFSGVPLTLLARCDDAVFSRPASCSDGHDFSASLACTTPPASKLGSLQQFVSAVSNCEDMGPKHFSAHEVHKIAVLDIRLANTDRNGANILVQKNGSGYNLVPIDHGYCLPETVSPTSDLCLALLLLHAPASLISVAGVVSCSIAHVHIWPHRSWLLRVSFSVCCHPCFAAAGGAHL